MEIIDTEKTICRDIQRGDIVNECGSFFIVTDVRDEEYGGTFVVYLETGKMDTVDIEELMFSINNPEENVSLVSDSKLYIGGYM